MPTFNTGYRNALQVRPFNSSYVVNNAAPLPVAVSGGGGGGAEQPALQASPFRRSLDRQRATEAAGTSAYLTSLDAPLPGPDAPASLNLPRTSGGTYRGAYGVGPNAERTANAARQGLIARTRTTANFGFEDAGEGPNYLDRQQFAHDANTRANAGSASETGLNASKGKLMDAQAGDLANHAPLYPARAHLDESTAGLNEAKAGDLAATAPARVGDLEAGAELKRSQGKVAVAGVPLLKSQLADAQQRAKALQARNQFLESKFAAKTGTSAGSRVDRLMEGLAPQPATQPSDDEGGGAGAAPAIDAGNSGGLRDWTTRTAPNPATRPGEVPAGTPVSSRSRDSLHAAASAETHASALRSAGLPNVAMHAQPTPGAGPLANAAPTTRPTTRKPTAAEVAQIKELAGGDRQRAIQFALERGLDPYAD